MTQRKCDCNQGRRPCTCDDWPRADHKSDGVLLIATISILVVMGAYAYLRHLIGVPVL